MNMQEIIANDKMSLPGHTKHLNDHVHFLRLGHRFFISYKVSKSV